MNRGIFRLSKRPQPAETAKAGPRIHPSADRLPALALLLGLAAIGLRLMAIHQVLGDSLMNSVLLKAAMQAGEESTATVDKPPRGVPQSGLQARAMSVIARRAGQSATAEAWLAQGLADPASAFLTQFELCRLYWNEGDRTRALEACRGTQASAPYWLNRGYVADQDGDRREALDYYRMAAAVDPALIPAWRQLGRALFDLGLYDEAASAYEQVLHLDATAPVDVYDALGVAYLQLNKPALARDVLTRGLALYPTVRTYFLGMAETFRVEGDLTAADSWYARLLQRWPYDAYAWAARGQVARADGRPGDAVDYFQAAANNQPQAADYWLQLASAAAASDDTPLALRAYRQAMALQPENATVWLNAGRFFLAAQQLDEARQVIDHVLALQPDNDEARTLLDELERLPNR
jgi:tetratricopeptide (TPR) repeat protein